MCNIFLILWFFLACGQCEICYNESITKIQNIFVKKTDNNIATLRRVKIEKEALPIDEYKGRICLDNITKCMENDEDYISTVDHLSSYLFSSFPPFDLNAVEGVSEECRKQSRIYLEDLKKFKLWALKMYDSTAKMPSGILNGNVNQFGDFDMCLNAENDQVSGQYCLASMEIQAPQSLYLNGLHKLVHSHYHFKSKLEDPGHRVPKFSSINWALCVPSACSPKDVELGLKNTLEKIFSNTQFQLRYEVQSSMCQKKSEEKLPFSTYLAISGFVLIFLWELLATVYDYSAVGDKNDFVIAFSLKKNIQSMTNTKRSTDDIEAVHGIRCLNALLLLLSHKSMALFFLPYINRTEMATILGRPFSVLARAASLYTDPFIMISGMLTTYALLGKLNKTKKLNVINEYISRLFRILPPFIVIIIFCTFILPYLSNGPLWNLVIKHHSNVCKKNWWRNVLFIHNYFGFADMCLTHTHHIGIDTQLFFVSPFFIYTIWKWPKRGTFVLVSLAIISTIYRYYVTYSMRLSNYIHYGTSIKQLFDTADNMYILPAHRATVYIMGILLGYILKNYSHTQISKKLLNLGYAFALLTICVSFFGPVFMGNINYVYDPLDGALNAAIAPILWCFSFAWVIFTYKLGYRGLIENILSHNFFKLWTKISYTVYLTQFPIYFYNVGTTRTATEYGVYSAMFNFKEYSWVIALSALLTLTIELPFQNLGKVLIKNNKIKRDNVQTVKSDEGVKEKLN